jgi:hypothetical protein
MKGPCFAPGHGCTSQTPQCQPKRLYARRQQQSPNRLSSGAVRVRLRPSGRVAAPR